ncbi:MAG: DeoR/GlpR family DNA-binding transcription regulator [bacterium]|nr:DeoR/GlpR family DNA-binding transcription regulator [bacterium]
MNRNERQSHVADLIVENGSILVEELVRKFGVSPATARRDLDELAHQQFIVRTHGGAALAPSTGALPLRYRSARMGAEKRRIAEAAVAMLRPGDVVAMNGGTTTTEIAQELGAHAASDNRFDTDSITVVTNAVNIAYELSVREEVQVVVTGGVARSRTYELIGPLTSLVLPAIDIHTVFIGADSISAEHGVLTQHDGEAAVGAALIQAASRVVLVADHTKFTTRSFARICDLNEIDLVITDSGLDPEIAETIRAAGPSLTLV